MPKVKKKRVVIFVAPDVLEQLKEAAVKDRRSLSQYLSPFLEKVASGVSTKEHWDDVVRRALNSKDDPSWD